MTKKIECGATRLDCPFGGFDEMYDANVCNLPEGEVPPINASKDCPIWNKIREEHFQANASSLLSCKDIYL